MCTPGMGANLTLASQGVGTIASSAGAYMNTAATRSAANANALAEDYAAQQAQKRGDLALQQQYLKTAQLKGTQRARLAANGGDLGVGSPLDILTSTDVMGANDAATVQSNTNAEVYAHQVGAANFRGAAAAANPWASGLSSLMTGAGAVASKWYDFKKQGLKPFGH